MELVQKLLFSNLQLIIVPNMVMSMQKENSIQHLHMDVREFVLNAKLDIILIKHTHVLLYHLIAKQLMPLENVLNVLQVMKLTTVNV
jgi:hypothetical protein